LAGVFPSFEIDVAELKARMVAAELEGRRTIADALAEQLEARLAARAAGNVIEIRAGRSKA